MPSLRQLVPVLAAAILAGCGHVDRQMTIRSQPEGALVYLNGQEVGRTPFTTDFTWYGWYDLTIRHEGYETLKTSHYVAAPWWQWIPFDLAADVLPGRKVDRKQYAFTLRPQPEGGVEADVLVDRAQSMRPLLESGEFTRRRPVGTAASAATQPAESADDAQDESAAPLEMQSGNDAQAD